MSLFTLEEIPPEMAAHLPAQAHIDYPKQGMTSDVAFVTGVGGSVAVKRCNRAIYLDWLWRECMALSALADRKLPVPAVVAYVEVAGTSGPEGWLAMTRLPGQSLWGVIVDTRSLDRAPLFLCLGKLLRTLHSTSPPAAMKRDVDWLSRKLSEAEQNLPWCDGTEALLVALRRSKPEPVPDVLVHGDLALDNVLIGMNGELSLIDWSAGTCGDYRNDVALALQTEPEIALSEEDTEAFYEGYGCKPLDKDTRLWFEQLYEFF